jgi:uncharacterized protein (DUF427 family)
MTDRPFKIPNPEHPITIEGNPGWVVVTLGGQVLADSRNALTMREAKYPAVHYIPRADVDMAWLRLSEHVTYCPFKGDCSYYSLAIGGEGADNAVWTYEAPFPAVEAIKGHLAFYADRVAITENA